MNRNWTDADGGRIARGVIWRLLALSGLALRAGVLPPPLRFVLLCILRGAAFRLRPIVLRMAGARGYRLVLPPSFPSETGGMKAEAEAKRLALCYRALARAAGDLLRSADDAAIAWQASRDKAALLRRIAMTLRPWPRAPGPGRLCAGMAHDTS
jgi:hypothetical protein